MSLIASPRHRPADLAHWAELEDLDRVNGRRLVRSGKPDLAIDAVVAFAMAGRCYASVSWGKDSTVLAHLVWRANQHAGLNVPLVHFKQEWWHNPDCDLVRDQFLSAFPGLQYDEIVMTYDYAREVHEHRSLYLEDAYRRAADLHGWRYITGLRGDESRVRRLRMKGHGTSSRYTCAPIGWWTASEVYAYLAHFNLPVHPAYACSRGGLLDRDWLRVDGLGEMRGEERGRREWEAEYYPTEMNAIRARDAKERACR